MASAAPTPLYRLYQQEFGLTPFMLTVVFAAYSFGLLASLLTLGSLSDHLGRRPVVLAALAINALAMGVFLFANSVGWLIAARLIQGFSGGIAATAIGAAVVDLNPARGPTLNAVAPFTGLTVGALGSAALITFAPAPEHTVYGVLFAATLALLAALWRMPETAKAELGAWASLVPRIYIPRAARKAMIAITPLNIAAWTLGGFYFSLVPSLVRVTTGLTAPLIGGGVVAALTVTAALSVLMARRWNPRTTLAFATLVVAAGVAVILLGVHEAFGPGPPRRQPVHRLRLRRHLLGQHAHASAAGVARRARRPARGLLRAELPGLQRHGDRRRPGDAAHRPSGDGLCRRQPRHRAGARLLRAHPPARQDGGRAGLASRAAAQ